MSRLALARSSAVDFDAATATAPLPAGGFAVNISPAWDGPSAPNGGHLAAMMLRAAEAALGRPDLPARVVTVHFLRPAQHGMATIDVEVRREAVRSATASASMHQDGRVVCVALITWSQARPGVPAFGEPAPAVPGPDELPELRLPSAPPLFDRLDVRPAFGPAPFSGGREAVTGGWISLREDSEPIDSARLCAFADIWWPALFGRRRTPVSVPTLELTIQLRHTQPVAGPILGHFSTTVAEEGHVEESGSLWSPAGVLLAQSRQLALVLEP